MLFLFVFASVAWRSLHFVISGIIAQLAPAFQSIG